MKSLMQNLLWKGVMVNMINCVIKLKEKRIFLYLLTLSSPRVGSESP